MNCKWRPKCINSYWGLGQLHTSPWAFEFRFFLITCWSFRIREIEWKKSRNHQMTPNNWFSLNETQITIKETNFFLFYCYICFIWCKSIVGYHLKVTLFFIVTEYGNLTELYKKVESPRSQFAINPNPPWGVYAFWP